MLWLYRLQQRLSITAAEGTALLVASGALVAGLAVRQIQASSAPPAAALLAENDRLAAIDRAAAATPAYAADTTAPAAATTAPAGPVADAPARPRRPRAGAPAPHSIAINSASAQELERLPRIGPALAARIVEYRSAHGPFSRVGQLEDVRGIGPRMLEQIEPYVTL